MTEQLSSLASSVARRSRLTLSRATVQATSPSLRVLVRMPSPLLEQGRGVSRSLGAVFEKTCGRVGLPRTAKVETAVSASGAWEVFADDRPVAIFPGGPAAGTVDAVVEATHWALLRRLPVLLHDADVSRLSPALGITESDRSREVLEYVLSNGVSLEHLAALPARPWLDELRAADVAEALLAQLPASVSVSVPESILSGLVDSDLDAVVDVRHGLLLRLGAGFPDLELSIEGGPEARTRLFLNDVEGPWVQMAEGSDWRALVSTLEGLLLDHASWFIRIADLVDGKRRVANLFHDLVEISDLNVSEAELTACVRCLLANHDSVRNLPRVLWHLIEASQRSGGVDEVLLAEPHMITPEQSTRSLHAHPELSASEVRRGVAYEDWSGGGAREPSPAVSLPLVAENELVAAADSRALGVAEWQVLRATYEHGDVEIVAAHDPVAIRRLRQALYCLPDPPRVIATRELPPDRHPPDIVRIQERHA